MGKKTTTKRMIEDFDLPALFDLYCKGEKCAVTGQLPVDEVINALTTSRTHRASHLAKMIGVNVDHLKGAIVLLTGMTLTELILQWRLMLAKHLLRTTKQSCSSIAKQCGYCNSISLTLAFEKNFKQTPLDYRNS